ncbi:unnamed protein product (mitochondrion) [Plasmodiophora brassicae]|uniref:Uncharacterized protein n=1 Tax=Plasmodiophora brassicae TaxID=37360 RepID=A0A3P3YLF1_PLABS|nr:unnamed protein product [Plasmodiophora brassicae]
MLADAMSSTTTRPGRFHPDWARPLPDACREWLQERARRLADLHRLEMEAWEQVHAELTATRHDNVAVADASALPSSIVQPQVYDARDVYVLPPSMAPAGDDDRDGVVRPSTGAAESVASGGAALTPDDNDRCGNVDVDGTATLPGSDKSVDDVAQVEAAVAGPDEAATRQSWNGAPASADREASPPTMDDGAPATRPPGHRGRRMSSLRTMMGGLLRSKSQSATWAPLDADATTTTRPSSLPCATFNRPTVQARRRPRTTFDVRPPPAPGRRDVVDRPPPSTTLSAPAPPKGVPMRGRAPTASMAPLLAEEAARRKAQMASKTKDAGERSSANDGYGDPARCRAPTGQGASATCVACDCTDFQRSPFKAQCINCFHSH